MKDYMIAPSILSADFAQLGNEVTRVLDAGGDIVHFDVMDNHYVPNLTFGAMICQALRDYGVTAQIDVHLMTEPVDNLVEPFAKAGANTIMFHPDASKHVDRTLQFIRENGCMTGLALSPATPLSVLDHVLYQLDSILIMTVNPGFGGQKFITTMLDKITEARAMIDKTGRDIRLAVDGGVNKDTIAEIAKAGADVFVAGSAIFHTADYYKAIQELREKMWSRIG
jgi:ribulose-phosphate 3-epimerase